MFFAELAYHLLHVAFGSRAASIRLSETSVGKPVANNYKATGLKGISALFVMRYDKIFANTLRKSGCFCNIVVV